MRILLFLTFIMKRIDLRLVLALFLATIFLVSAIAPFEEKTPLKTEINRDFVDFDYARVFNVLEIEEQSCPEPPSVPYRSQGF